MIMVASEAKGYVGYVVGSYYMWDHLYVGYVDGIIYEFTFYLMEHFLLWPLFLKRGKSGNETISGY